MYSRQMEMWMLTQKDDIKDIYIKTLADTYHYPKLNPITSSHLSTRCPYKYR